MVRRTFSVAAVGDEEAKIYYCESDVDGLHIEAETIEEFESLMMGPVLVNLFNSCVVEKKRQKMGSQK